MKEVYKLKCRNKTKSLLQIKEMLKAGLNTEFICEERFMDDNVVFMCFEQYYIRCSNFVALSVMLVENEDCQEAVVVGMGGGNGVLNMSWGANRSFAKKAIKCLGDIGFAE